MLGGALIDPVLQMILRGALAVLFLWAAAHKVRDLAGFRAALAAYELLPARAVHVAAALLIVAEIGISVSLVTSAGIGGACAAAALLGLYTMAIAINLIRGRRHIDCGCVGAAARRPLSAALLQRNAVLIVAALASALPSTGRSVAWIDGMTIGAAIVALALLYAAADELIANAPRIAALAAERVTSHFVEAPPARADHA